jgi:hypothetical protein
MVQLSYKHFEYFQHLIFFGWCHIWWQVDSTTGSDSCTIQHYGPQTNSFYSKLVSFSLLFPKGLALTNTLACYKIHALWIRNVFIVQALGAMPWPFFLLVSLVKMFLIRILLFAWMELYRWSKIKEEEQDVSGCQWNQGAPKFFCKFVLQNKLGQTKKTGRMATVLFYQGSLTHYVLKSLLRFGLGWRKYRLCKSIIEISL